MFVAVEISFFNIVVDSHTSVNPFTRNVTMLVFVLRKPASSASNWRPFSVESCCFISFVYSVSMILILNIIIIFFQFLSVLIYSNLLELINAGMATIFNSRSIRETNIFLYFSNRLSLGSGSAHRKFWKYFASFSLTSFLKDNSNPVDHFVLTISKSILEFFSMLNYLF